MAEMNEWMNRAELLSKIICSSIQPQRLRFDGILMGSWYCVDEIEMTNNTWIKFKRWTNEISFWCSTSRHWSSLLSQLQENRRIRANKGKALQLGLKTVFSLAGFGRTLEAGASIPPETMMHFPPVSDFPPQFYLFPKNFLILIRQNFWWLFFSHRPQISKFPPIFAVSLHFHPVSR